MQLLVHAYTCTAAIFSTRRTLKALLHKAIFPSTCNSTDDESITRQVAGYVLHGATYLATLQKVEALSQHNFFVVRHVTKRGCYTCNFICNLSCNTVVCKLQKKLPHVTVPLTLFCLGGGAHCARTDFNEL